MATELSAMVGRVLDVYADDDRCHNETTAAMRMTRREHSRSASGGGLFLEERTQQECHLN